MHRNSFQRLTLLLTVTLLVAGCVTTGNQCGNEQRDWQALTFPKGNYCSVPQWVPFRQSYERANKAVCKVHDNNSGVASTMSIREADSRFLCDYLKRSTYPWGVRHITGYLSYLVLRVGVSSSIERDKQAVQDTNNGSTDHQCKR